MRPIGWIGVWLISWLFIRMFGTKTEEPGYIIVATIFTIGLLFAYLGIVP